MHRHTWVLVCVCVCCEVAANTLNSVVKPTPHIWRWTTHNQTENTRIAFASLPLTKRLEIRATIVMVLTVTSCKCQSNQSQSKVEGVNLWIFSQIVYMSSSFGTVQLILKILKILCGIHGVDIFVSLLFYFSETLNDKYCSFKPSRLKLEIQFELMFNGNCLLMADYQINIHAILRPTRNCIKAAFVEFFQNPRHSIKFYIVISTCLLQESPV